MGDDREHRPEDLLARHPRGVVQAGDHRGLDEETPAPVGRTAATAGEPAALVLLDAVVRLLPGVMGKLESAAEESFSDGLLEHPHYTKPNLWEDTEIPEILLSGDHKAIAAWKRRQREELTRRRCPENSPGWRR